MREQTAPLVHLMTSNLQIVMVNGHTGQTRYIIPNQGHQKEKVFTFIFSAHRLSYNKLLTSCRI